MVWPTLQMGSFATAPDCSGTASETTFRMSSGWDAPSRARRRKPASCCAQAECIPTNFSSSYAFTPPEFSRERSQPCQFRWAMTPDATAMQLPPGRGDGTRSVMGVTDKSSIEVERLFAGRSTAATGAKLIAGATETRDERLHRGSDDFPCWVFHGRLNSRAATAGG
jgi:hypothetical protein